MATRPSSTQLLLPSLLDRLLDDEPDLSDETPQSAAKVVRHLKQSVRRDLEDLLNTRWRCVNFPTELSNLEDSLVNYGLPDFTAAELNAAQNPAVLLRAIQDCIRRFEPRLRTVRLAQIEASDKVSRTFRFRIEAELCVEPAELVQYDSSLEVMTGTILVEGGNR